MRTDETICLNSIVDGKQPYIEDRIYYGGASAWVSPPPFQVTDAGCYMKKIQPNKCVCLGLMDIPRIEIARRVYHWGGRPQQ